ncbi:MAG: hypothetical protein WBW93_01755, partial [Steroidobacteraceae bacterium]
MRSSRTLLAIIAWAVLPIAQAQTAAPPSAVVQQGGSAPGPRSVAAPAREAKTTRPARPSPERHSRAPPA